MDLGYSRSVVEKVMGKIVTDITKYASTVDCSGCIPVIEENEVCQLPERAC